MFSLFMHHVHAVAIIPDSLFKSFISKMPENSPVPASQMLIFAGFPTFLWEVVILMFCSSLLTF